MNNPVIEGPDLFSLGASLAVVVAAVLLVGWLYSRLRCSGGSAGNLINVVASRAIGPKERLMLVEVAGQQLLVGMTATTVQTLHTFDRPVAAETIETDGGGFGDRLRSAIRGMGK